MSSQNSQRSENFQSFMQRMEMFFPHSQCVQASVFYKLIKNEFRSFKRRSQTNELGEPLRYFEHLRGTALILIDEACVTDFVTIMAALGHDAIEDTRMSLEEVTLICGPEVSKTIALCSKCPKEGFFKRLVLHGTWQVLMVKVADRIHNLRTLGENKAFIEKTVAETEQEYIHLSNLMVKITPSEFKHNAEVLQELLIIELNRIKTNKQL